VLADADGPEGAEPGEPEELSMHRTIPWVGGTRGAMSRAHRIASLSDDELALAYVIHGDNLAFRALYERTAPFLLAVARRRIRQQEVAEDLVQQAFLNAHAARERFELGSSFRPWITRILMNLILDHHRAERRRPLADLEPCELPAPEATPVPERNEDKHRTLLALEKLGARKREVVELHWLEGEPFPEVARRLGERLSTVKVRAHRAYRELRRTLEA
jgi:RNA polymerase sigma-70 factor (ECF subfamily)